MRGSEWLTPAHGFSVLNAPGLVGFHFWWWVYAPSSSPWFPSILVASLCSSLVFVFSQSWPELGTGSMTTWKAFVQRPSRWLPQMGKLSWSGRHQQPEEQIETQFWFSLSLIVTFTFKTTDMYLTPYELLFVYKLSQTHVGNHFPVFNKTSLISCSILSVQSPRCPQTLMGRSPLQHLAPIREHWTCKEQISALATAAEGLSPALCQPECYPSTEMVP